MTFYEVTNTFALQGNIEVKVFDSEGKELESRCFRDLSDLDCVSTDTEDLEDYQVTYMYATMSADGEAWMVIEVMEAEE